MKDWVEGAEYWLLWNTMGGVHAGTKDDAGYNNKPKDGYASEDVDGGLIGGASLKAEDFMAIVNAF